MSSSFHKFQIKAFSSSRLFNNQLFSKSFFFFNVMFSENSPKQLWSVDCLEENWNQLGFYYHAICCFEQFFPKTDTRQNWTHNLVSVTKPPCLPLFHETWPIFEQGWCWHLTESWVTSTQFCFSWIKAGKVFRLVRCQDHAETEKWKDSFQPNCRSNKLLTMTLNTFSDIQSFADLELILSDHH